MERYLGVRQGLLQHCLNLCLADLRRLKPPLSGGRSLHREQSRRPCLRCLGRPVLRLTAGELQLVLELSNLPRHRGLPGMLLPEEARLVA